MGNVISVGPGPSGTRVGGATDLSHSVFVHHDTHALVVHCINFIELRYHVDTHPFEQMCLIGEWPALAIETVYSIVKQLRYLKHI